MKLWSKLVGAISETDDATPLALFRIAIGLGTLHSISSVVFAGLVPVIWMDQSVGGMRSLHASWPFVFVGGMTQTTVWAFVFGALLGGLLLVLGIGGRFAALFTSICAQAILDLNGHAGGSYDQLLLNGLWLVVLADGSQTLSLSAYRKHGQWWPEVLAPAWPRWLILYQLILMYWTTGLQKVSSHWVPGGELSALYFILQQPTWQRWDMSWIAPFYKVTQLSTLITWLWEFLAPLWIVAVWYASTPNRGGRLRNLSNKIHLRSLFAITGVIMHLVILVTMNVGPFSMISLAYYTSMVRGFEVRRLFQSKTRASPKIAT